MLLSKVMPLGAHRKPHFPLPTSAYCCAFNPLLFLRQLPLAIKIGIYFNPSDKSTYWSQEVAQLVSELGVSHSWKGAAMVLGFNGVWLEITYHCLNILPVRAHSGLLRTYLTLALRFPAMKRVFLLSPFAKRPSEFSIVVFWGLGRSRRVA